MYTVLTAFIDAQDSGHFYCVGDSFPRSGAEVSEDRLKELSSDKNRCGAALIAYGGPEEGPSEAEGDTLEPEAGVRSSDGPEAKEKPRKGQRRHDRTDS